MDKTPFYKVFPIEDVYRYEMERQKELERLKESYPAKIQEIQRMIEARVDELEYEGSRIYDENPDFHMMEMEVQKIYENMRDDDWLKSLIHVLFGQEVYCRRCRNKRW